MQGRLDIFLTVAQPRRVTHVLAKAGCLRAHSSHIAYAAHSCPSEHTHSCPSEHTHSCPSEHTHSCPSVKAHARQSAVHFPGRFLTSAGCLPCHFKIPLFGTLDISLVFPAFCLFCFLNFVCVLTHCKLSLKSYRKLLSSSVFHPFSAHIVLILRPGTVDPLANTQ